ncbi:MAG: AAA family ATPase [Syntrophobacteraceae bacterium]
MYNEYFGLNETPFSIAPDPRYLYMSAQHKEALAHLLYGVNNDGGFVLLTGEVGTGKTTVCRCLLEQIPEECDLAFILNPKLTVHELLSTICDEFNIRYPKGKKSIKVFIDRINAYLLDAHSKGRKVVLIIDEAQNLSTEVLEQMRLLTNLETDQRKLLQIIMIGQPELRDMLQRPELRQLAQRVTAHYHLGTLSEEETAAYVKHRLAVAGLRRQLFSPSTITRLYRLSGGVPRRINILCDRALLGTYVQGKEKVDKVTVSKAAREVLGELKTGGRQSKHPARRLLVLLAFVVCGALFSSIYFRESIQLLISSGAVGLQRLSSRIVEYRKPIPEGNKLATAKEEHAASAVELRKPISDAGRLATVKEEPAASIENKSSSQVDDTAQAPDESSKAPAPQNSSETAALQTAAPTPESQEPISQPTSLTGAEPANGIKSDEGLDAIDHPAENVSLMKLEWNQTQPASRSEAMSFETLFKLWGMAFRTRGTDACRQADSQGLRCLNAQGGLEDLRRLNRPAILRLSDAEGQRFYGTLVKLEDSAATFVVGDKTVKVSLDEVAVRWRGEYTLLWKPPPRYRGAIQIGDRGAAVDWLVSRFTKVQGESAPGVEKAVFEGPLVDEVRKFQLANGLQPDGVAGPQTLICLDRESGSGQPLLIKKQKDN